MLAILILKPKLLLDGHQDLVGAGNPSSVELDWPNTDAATTAIEVSALPSASPNALLDEPLISGAWPVTPIPTVSRGQDCQCQGPM